MSKQDKRIFYKKILFSDDDIRKIADEYADQFYYKEANPLSHESLTEPFIDGFKKAIELINKKQTP